MRLESVLSCASFRGLGDIPPSTLQSYDARMKHLAIIAAQLMPKGYLLHSLGPLAPPCLALPYAAMREKLIHAAEKLLNAVRAEGSKADYQRFEMLMGGVDVFPRSAEISRGPLALIFGLPQLKVYWSAAPQKWWGPRTVVPAPQGGLRGLGTAFLAEFPPVEIDLANLRASGSWFTRASFGWAAKVWNTPIVRAARSVGRVASKGLIVLFLADFAWDRIVDIYDWWTVKEPPPNVAADVQAAIDFFNNDFLPATAQQWQALLRVMAGAGSNPAAILSGLNAIDPWAEEPMPATPPDGDTGSWKDRARLPLFRRGHPWAALGTLVGGTGLCLAAGRE